MSENILMKFANIDSNIKLTAKFLKGLKIHIKWFVDINLLY